jgi:glycosyltransferase involved in cell wall biosynthesis
VLPDALETCVRQNYERLRILVSDNASTDGSREVVEEFRNRDKRVEYINPGTRLGMSSHWEFALNHVSSGMVCVIGDDDGLMPQAMLDLDEAIKAHPGTEAFHRGHSAYLYPNLASEGAGKLTLEINTAAERRDSKEWLAKVFNNEVWYTELPSIYYGCASVQILDKLRARSGRVIHSMTPDGYTAVAIAAVTDHYLHLGKPFTITGGSRHSTGYSSNCPGGPEEPIKRYLSEIDIPFHPSLTFVKSIYAIQGEVCLRAAEQGLIPKDVQIDWRRGVCRALNDFHVIDYDTEWRSGEVEKLRTLAVQVGVLPEFDAMMAWVSSEDFKAGRVPPETLPLESHVTPHPVLHVDLRPLEVRNIAEAARAADVIFDASCQVLQQRDAAAAKPLKFYRKAVNTLPTLEQNLADSVAACESALSSLYASSRWKIAALLSNPFRAGKFKTHAALEKAVKAVASVGAKLKKLCRNLPSS